MNYYVDKLPINYENLNTHKLDKQGVIMSKIPYTQHFDYHTSAIASYALANQDNMKIFMPQAQWLVKNLDKDGVYRHNFKLPYYDFKLPWLGGLCQGLAISALIRAYQMTNERIYLDSAKKAFNCLNRNVDDDGCRFIDQSGYTWIEEYAVKPQPQILNGFIYALFGIYDLFSVSEEGYNLWNKCVSTLENNLCRYDLGYWSRYSLVDAYPATLKYHKIHIEQLNAMHRMTGKTIFSRYAIKWGNNLDSYSNRLEAQLTREMSHIKKHGIGGIQVYLRRRRWLREKT